MSQLDPKTLTNEELRKHLVTSDYLGKAWKEKCLDELIEREVDKAFNGTSYPDSN